MATGRRPITSDKRPNATAAAAVTASIAAEIDNVAVRSSFLVAARWLGMKMKKALKATTPAAIRGDGHTSTEAKSQGGGVPGSQLAALVAGCSFHDEYRGHAQFPTGCQALCGTEHDQCDRCQNADGRMAG